MAQTYDFRFTMQKTPNAVYPLCWSTTEIADSSRDRRKNKSLFIPVKQWPALCGKIFQTDFVERLRYSCMLGCVDC